MRKRAEWRSDSLVCRQIEANERKITALSILHFFLDMPSQINELAQIVNLSYHNHMSKTILLLALIATALTISIPCVQYQSSKNGNASDCSINRIDENTIEWGAIINFNADYNWNVRSFSSLLADMGSPRLPIEADISKCFTKEGRYSKGDSVFINCTQSFSVIPVGYSNVITAFDGDDYPLGFSTKIPLSSPAPNLQRQ